jgi:hypothetical protein
MIDAFTRTEYAGREHYHPRGFGIRLPEESTTTGGNWHRVTSLGCKTPEEEAAALRSFVTQA